ncbi:MAG: tRNA preQ1(34) S-adenosylmethionine ribosyltransferase-isomerase QueA, partial [Thermodesulfobacteriota bacterium]|nr:tRNA preQ1(34) S-adenosylmethionine ribosyltransferase-isomerase QueA [Thermodesulfobacteriota bacterium]
PFSRLPEFLPKGALLVANDSKVIPARLFGRKKTRGRVEFLLLTPISLIDYEPTGRKDMRQATAHGLIHASKAPKPGDEIYFSQDFYLEVLEKKDFGLCGVRLFWRGDLGRLFQKLGHTPLPPYIRRPDTHEDARRYQTVYANKDKPGSVAAPTAGLHFTQKFKKKLQDQGFEWAAVTLHVGYATFSPVRCPDIRDHPMHTEYVEISKQTATAVKKAKREGRALVAVGTTSVRALEGAFAKTGEIAPFAGWTDLFLYPGRPFNVVDGLLTNFHLPESSLLIMVCGFAGREVMLSAYEKAKNFGFRFYSYGDAMLIL